MAKVVIFGVSQWADLARFYLTHDSPHEVVAFTVDREYLDSTEHDGLPVVAFEDVESKYPPGQFSMFIPISFKRMNHLRAEKYQSAKDRGYDLISYVSSRATTFPDFQCGDNCLIFEDNTIQPFTSIGNNVVLWSGNHIGHHSVIKDHVSFTSHVVLSGHCLVESFAFFGVNATIRDGIHIAEGSFIAMAAAVTKHTDPWGVYKGNPAKKGDVLSTDLDF